MESTLAQAVKANDRVRTSAWVILYDYDEWFSCNDLTCSKQGMIHSRFHVSSLLTES